jgi:protein-tyrosine kinase
MEIINSDTEKAEQQTSSKAMTPTAQSTGLNALSYVQTKVVPLRPDCLERNRIVAYNKNSNMGGAFDLLRTQVLKIMEENGWRTLAITSPTPGAGKTVLAINLAMSIAHHTTKTALLVDFDLRRPKVGEYLGLPMDKSLNELLADEVELQEVLVNPTLPRFVVLPTREPIPLSTEVLSSPAVSHLIADLRERYNSRIVIFDLPPLLSSDDVINVLPRFDCVLLVVANGLNTKKEIEDSLHHLGTANLIGTVLNKAEPENRSYY